MSHCCPECGAVLGKTRSLQDLRRFFALIKAGCYQWREDNSYGFHPESEEEFRSWILIRTGWADVAKVEIPARYAHSQEQRAAFRDVVEGASRALRGPGGYNEMRVRGDALEIVTARSISFRRTDQREFNRVRDAVQELLELELGVSSEQLLREKAA